jgi:hypothetical protein
MSNQENEFNQLADEAQKWLVDKIHWQKSTAIAMAILPIYHVKTNDQFSFTPALPSLTPLGDSTNTTKSNYLNSFDVIAGSAHFQNPGNIRFRKLINDLAGVYLHSTSGQKNPRSSTMYLN